MLTLGAAVGGVVTGLFGATAAFILDSVTFLASAAFIASIHFPKRPPRVKTKLTIGKLFGITDTVEGIRYVKDRPRVLAFLLVKPAWGVGGGILTLLAVFGERIFPVGRSAATGIGVLFAARGIGTAIGPIVARRIAGEGRRQMQTTIGFAFLIGGAFYIAFGTAKSFLFALLALGLAHTGGSILWVFSTVLLQRDVEDNFRGRVFAAELALLTFTMAASNYFIGELLDRFGWSPRVVTAGVGIFFLLPGLLWFVTRRWWDREKDKELNSPKTEQVIVRYHGAWCFVLARGALRFVLCTCPGAGGLVLGAGVCPGAGPCLGALSLVRKPCPWCGGLSLCGNLVLSRRACLVRRALSLDPSIPHCFDFWTSSRPPRIVQHPKY